MERKRKIKGPDGQEHDAVEVGFRGTGEYWNEYLLDDGSVLRMKVVVTSVLRLEGLYDDEGQPAYVAKSNNILVVSPADDLMQGKE